MQNITTSDNYAQTLSSLLAACIRSAVSALHPGDYMLPLSEEQGRYAETLYDTLQLVLEVEGDNPRARKRQRTNCRFLDTVHCTYY